MRDIQILLCNDHSGATKNCQTLTLRILKRSHRHLLIENEATIMKQCDREEYEEVQ